jgi:hypothetical protein
MHDITGMIAVIFFFTSTAVILGSYIFTRHRERIGIIQKGLTSDEIRALYARGAGQGHPFTSLKWGIIFVCIGLAVLAGMVLHSYFWVEGGVYPALIALFVGIGLVVFYLISRKRSAE